MITRKDLVADYMLERIRDANDVRRDRAGLPIPDEDAHDDGARGVFGWMPTRGLSRANSRATSRRLLEEEVESIGRPASTVLMPHDLESEVRTNRLRKTGGDIAPLKHLVVDETEDLEDTVVDVAAVESDHIGSPIEASLNQTQSNMSRGTSQASTTGYSKTSIQQRMAMSAMGGGPAIRSFKERPLLTVVDSEDSARTMFEVASRSLRREEVMDFLLRGSAGASTGGGIASARNHRALQEKRAIQDNQSQGTENQERESDGYLPPSAAESGAASPERSARLAPSVDGSQDDVDKSTSLQ